MGEKRFGDQQEGMGDKEDWRKGPSDEPIHNFSDDAMRPSLRPIDDAKEASEERGGFHVGQRAIKDGYEVRITGFNPLHIDTAYVVPADVIGDDSETTVEEVRLDKLKRKKA